LAGVETADEPEFQLFHSSDEEAAGVVLTVLLSTLDDQLFHSLLEEEAA